jgi:hypothetical protein
MNKTSTTKNPRKDVIKNCEKRQAQEIFIKTMADFDTIYEETDDDSNAGEYMIPVPDPIIIRGAGNITM